VKRGRGRPPADPAIVAEALRRVAAGAHRDDVAAEMTTEGKTISVATIRRAQAAAGVAPPRAAPKAKRREAPRAARRKPAKVGRLPAAPKPIPLLPDALDELTQALEQTKGHLDALVGKQGFSAAGNLLRQLLVTKAAIERERRPVGSEAAQLLARGAAGVRKILDGVEVIEARERETGVCARCAGTGKPSEASA
jgi:hypothetical protein